MKTIRERIQDLRMEKNLSSKDLSVTLHWPKGYVDRLESGRQSPSKEQVEQLASFFGVSAAYIRCETNDKTRQDGWMDFAYETSEQDSPSPQTKPVEKTPVETADFSDNGMSLLTALIHSEEMKAMIRKIVREELGK